MYPRDHKFWSVPPLDPLDTTPHLQLGLHFGRKKPAKYRFREFIEKFSLFLNQSEALLKHKTLSYWPTTYFDSRDMPTLQSQWLEDRISACGVGWKMHSPVISEEHKIHGLIKTEAALCIRMSRKEHFRIAMFQFDGGGMLLSRSFY